MILDVSECLAARPGVRADLRSAHAERALAGGATRVDRRLPSLPAPPLPTHRLGSHVWLAGTQRACDDLRLPVPLGLSKRRGFVAGHEQGMHMFRERRSAAGQFRALREAAVPRSNTESSPSVAGTVRAAVRSCRAAAPSAHAAVTCPDPPNTHPGPPILDDQGDAVRARCRRTLCPSLLANP
jgi:hypothetical protein